MVITNFTENHRSNSVFPWEQIGHDVYIQDTRPSISAQDHSSEWDWECQASRQDAKGGYSKQILWAGTSFQLLGWQPLSWHACQPSSPRDMLLTQPGSQKARLLTTSYSQAHKKKQMSSEYPGLWHNPKFSFWIGNRDEIIPFQDQLLPTGISFQLQGEALAHQSGEEEGGLINGVTPRSQQHASISKPNAA